MTGGLIRAAVSRVEAVRDDPEALQRFLEGDAWAPPVREVRPRGVPAWLWKFSPVTISEVDPTVEPPPGAKLVDETHLDLDKGWHALHYLLTETAWEGDEPGCYLVRGGEELIEDDELGYSSVRTLTPDQVRRFADFLDGLSRSELTARHNQERMMQLKVAPDALEPLLGAFDDLKKFVRVAADAGEALVVYLTT